MSDSADEILKRMQSVRREVGHDVKGIVATARTLTDWRYYVKHHPWLCTGAALALGFLLIPKRKRFQSEEARELVALLKKYNVGVTAPPSSGKGLLGSVVGLAAPMVMRTVMSVAQQKFGSAMSHGSARSEEREPSFEDFNVPT